MSEKKQSFEEALARLEEIVRTLEKGEAKLEDSLKLFEEGTRLARQCERVLNRAEEKVRLLTAAGETDFEEPEAEE